MKKKTAPRKSERILLSQKTPTPQIHTHIHIHSTSSSSPSPPSKRTATMRKKVISHKSSGKGKNKEPSVKEESSHTSPIPSPPPSPKKATPGKSGQKSKGFVLHNTIEPANLESLEFKNKFAKTPSHYDPARFNSCTSYEFHKEVMEKRHLCLTYLVNLDTLANKGINVSPLFELLQWTPLLHIQKPVYPGLVREFYSNMRLIDGTIHSYVKRVHITLDTATIGTALGYKDKGPRAYMAEKWDSQVGITYNVVLQYICENLSSLHDTTPTHKALVENKVSMVKGGGVGKGTKSKKFMASESEYESRPETSKATESIKEILTEFLNMTEIMVQSHKTARKLAYENERAWMRCKGKVSLMLESLKEDLGDAREDEAEESDLHLFND
ncbi:uncharacterized protein DS421_9g258720 [Arachis hypogaea]|nr:uncharacterized protein DS421_9g258720 [Arachis hypogaea]